ncbi:MAG: hypothetical protein FJW96_11785, partial [Actinobacteria bacterium]|nr:hypothetical protein [Actinomycetota bacterium]
MKPDAVEQLRTEHAAGLAARIDTLTEHIAEHGADPECARQAHALKGAALTLALDVVAVAAAAIEAACAEDGGDAVSAARAVALAGRELHRVSASGAARHDLRGA